MWNGNVFREHIIIYIYNIIYINIYIYYASTTKIIGGKSMRLLRKDMAGSYLKGDFVYYWENGELRRSKYISAKEHSILTEDGEFVYDEVGKTWFLTELVAKEKR